MEELKASRNNGSERSHEQIKMSFETIDATPSEKGGTVIIMQRHGDTTKRKVLQREDNLTEQVLPTLSCVRTIS